MEDTGRTQEYLTARRAGLVGCTQCGAVHPWAARECRRCGAALASRDETSLQRVWAWLFAGMIAYIPANLYPMLVTNQFGKHHEATIVGGVIELAEHGSWGVAIIVFTASVLIPISKFIAIGYLAVSVRSASAMSGHGRQLLYEIVEFIGRWSMIDVFVVAILSALVQLKFVVTVNPGVAAVSFALSVAFTMLAAQNFDPRLIWDAYEADTH
ncbi:Paraquat-inducible protein A [Defluviimonas aquaemixtae]|uniref:Paraquat-inducible protein A n=1 Tax=Albidovulum aquaemixtae TaxID=1542388 RepID=A0A2R8BK69_9RHOB|nr:paraquat-inducible protein A [Defluviimonas aquaemixtae]SPH23764.1 Paraquat-inducible protein A [Defluviimonas aquaemixtae]